MPELPDVQIYIERLGAFVRGEPLERLELRNPFVLRSVTPIRTRSCTVPDYRP